MKKTTDVVAPKKTKETATKAVKARRIVQKRHANGAIKIEAEVDANNNIIAKRHYNSKGIILSREEYSGRYVVKSVIFNGNEKEILLESFYREKGKILRSVFYNTDGSPSFIEDYEYSSKGELTSKVVHGEDGTNYNVTLYSKGKPTLYKKYKDGALIYSYEYDENGQIKKSTKYKKDGSVEKVENGPMKLSEEDKKNFQEGLERISRSIVF